MEKYKYEEIIEYEKQNYCKDNLKNGRIVEISLENMKNNQEDLLKEVLFKSVNEDISQEDVGIIINQYKEINKLSDSIIRHNETFKSRTDQSETTRLSESEKKKMFHYHQTGDFNQEQLARMFNSTQSTVSRTVKKYSENED